MTSTNEKTPGQVAYEAHQKALRARIPNIADQSWHGWEDAFKAGWEATALAVRQPLLDRIAELEKELESFRNERAMRAAWAKGALINNTGTRTGGASRVQEGV